jgi:dTMP kinase
MKRRLKGGGVNRLDAFDLDFYQRVRQGYHKLVQAEPARWVIIDASRSFKEVQQEIRRVVMERLRA